MKPAALLGGLLLLLLPSRPAFPDAPQEIDRAVGELSAFLQRTLPDREGDALTVLPFLADGGSRMVLGERLAAELELALSKRYRRTHIGAGSQGRRVYTVTGELQPYASEVRVLCRLLGPDGVLIGASRADLRMSPELAGLLSPPSGDYTGQGLHGLEPESSLEHDLDPLEPDDAPGAEAQLVPGAPLERYLSPGDIDRFRFLVSEPDAVRLEALTSIDAQLLLYREGERVPFDVRGNANGKSILFEGRLQPGYYVAELMAFSPEIQGPYSISLTGTAAAADAYEPDDNPAEARALAPGDSQERTLAAGNADWVELGPAQPGFYELYTTGLAVDTTLALLRDGRVQVLSDDDSGPQANACLGFFLGPGRWLARVESKPPLADGPYTLVFEPLTPEQVFPGGKLRELTLRQRPTYLQLRVLRGAGYAVSCPGVEVRLYGLPGMKALQAGGSLALAPGDYLLALKGAEGQVARLAISEE